MTMTHPNSDALIDAAYNSSEEFLETRLHLRECSDCTTLLSTIEKMSAKTAPMAHLRLGLMQIRQNENAEVNLNMAIKLADSVDDKLVKAKAHLNLAFMTGDTKEKRELLEIVINTKAEKIAPKIVRILEAVREAAYTQLIETALVDTWEPEKISSLAAASGADPNEPEVIAKGDLLIEAEDDLGLIELNLTVVRQYGVLELKAAGRKIAAPSLEKDEPPTQQHAGEGFTLNLSLVLRDSQDLYLEQRVVSVRILDDSLYRGHAMIESSCPAEVRGVDIERLRHTGHI